MALAQSAVCYGRGRRIHSKGIVLKSRVLVAVEYLTCKETHREQGERVHISIEFSFVVLCYYSVGVNVRVCVNVFRCV